MINEDITKDIYKYQDIKYQKFLQNLIPNINPDLIIGVKTPELKNLAKIYFNNNDIDIFLNTLPHIYFEENQLHAFIINNIKDFNICIKEVNTFLPYINNWATCDQLNPKCFKKNHLLLLPYISTWLNSNDTYSIRFGIRMLMNYFLDDDYDIKYLDIVSNIKSDEYYINMMIAWFFQVALVKQYNDAVKYLENKKLNNFVHNKAISKAIDSYRIDNNTKEYLKKLKIKI